MDTELVTAASQALDDLREVSPQVRAAAILDRDGTQVASTTDTTELADAATRSIEAADEARRELGREAVTQIEMATGKGHVFVVCDATHVAIAITGMDPTVGLVFYDLKTMLRSLRESALAMAAATSNGGRRKRRNKERQR